MMISRAVEIVVGPLDGEAGAACPRTSLSPAERERARRFSSDADRRRFIVAHATLRRLLGARCGLPPESLQLEYGAHGKPRLAASRWQFSLSRSAALAAYAFARDRAVGIDVEAIRPLAQADAIAARAFPRLEWRAYAALPARERIAGFYRGWTRTEALAKGLGGGLSLPPEALDAALETRWVVRSFMPVRGFFVALAAERLN